MTKRTKKDQIGSALAISSPLSSRPSFEECNMEEAYDYGYIQGPSNRLVEDAIVADHMARITRTPR